MTIRTEAIDSYLADVDPDRRSAAESLIDMMRAELDGANERVQYGMAIFAKNRQDIVGLAVNRSFFSIYVPHSQVVEEHADSLGATDRGELCIRFDSLNKINLESLRILVRACASTLR